MAHPPNKDQLLPLINAHTNTDINTHTFAAILENSLIHLYSGVSIEIHAKLNLMLSSSSSSCSLYVYILLTLPVCVCVSKSRSSLFVGCDCLNIKIQSCYLPLGNRWVREGEGEKVNSGNSNICINEDDLLFSLFLFSSVFAYLNVRITIGIYYV